MHYCSEELNVVEHFRYRRGWVLILTPLEILQLCDLRQMTSCLWCLGVCKMRGMDWDFRAV